MLTYLFIILLILVIIVFAMKLYTYQNHKPEFFKDAFSKEFLSSRNLVSHRGYGKRGQIAENTYRAIHEAVLRGFTAHEFDVRVSKDNQIILFHGRDLSTTTNGKGRLETHTFDELKLLNWGEYLNSEKYEITSLDSILKDFGKKNILNIEIKRDWFDLSSKENLIVEKIRSYNLEKSVFISSFNLVSLMNAQRIIKKHNLAIKIGALLEPGFAFSLRLFLFELFSQPSFLHLPSTEITQSRMNRFKKKGYGVLVYTVNEKSEVDRLIELGVELVVTDNVSGFSVI